MSYSLLEKINNPEDLKTLESEKIPALCEEIRAFLIENVDEDEPDKIPKGLVDEGGVVVIHRSVL